MKTVRVKGWAVTFNGKIGHDGNTGFEIFRSKKMAGYYRTAQENLTQVTITYRLPGKGRK
jgi:hypothetical protein